MLKKAGQWVCRLGRFAKRRFDVLQDSILFVYDRMNEIFVVQKIYVRRQVTRSLAAQPCATTLASSKSACRVLIDLPEIFNTAPNSPSPPHQKRWLRQTKRSPMIVQINRPTVQAMVGSASSMKQATLSRLARTARCRLSNYQISQNSVLHLQDVLVKTLDRRKMTKRTAHRIGRRWSIARRKRPRRSQRRIRRITPPFSSRKNAD